MSTRDQTNTLEAAIQQARTALSSNPHRTLERGFREAIWAALGPLEERGRRRRTILAILATEYVLPHWQRVFPRDRRPEKMLDIARAVLAGSIDLNREAAERDSMWTAMNDIATTSYAVAVGYAAAQVVSVALYDESFEPDAVRLDRRDAEVDPEEHDASYLASMAASHGSPWTASYDADKRGQFWEWWLDEAVPAAHAMALKPVMSARAKELLDLVRADDTFVAAVDIENARGDVTRADLPELAAAYRDLTWAQRTALLTLVQDHIDDSTRELMIDYLRNAPDGVGETQDPVHIARTIAVCHHDRSFEHFMEYIEDPASLERRRAQLRATDATSSGA